MSTCGPRVVLPDVTRGGDTAQAVADLTEALRIATGQGARVSRLRAALDLARLAASCRPARWRTLLAEARADMPPSSVTDETAADDATGSSRSRRRRSRSIACSPEATA